jgi:BASS family bile acid:Na+ symporter
MVATGMSLERGRFAASLRRLTPMIWAKLLLATFILPPALVLVLALVLPIDLPAMGGLFLIAVAPGAPLMTRNVAQRGFDPHQAASYQVWGALVAPLAIPLLVGASGLLYGRTIWIPPREVLLVVIEKQFVPLFAGMALVWFAPVFSVRVRGPLNVIGNVLLTVAIIALLGKLGPALQAVNPWVAIAALALAGGCLAAGRWLVVGTSLSPDTLALNNVNRHVGLAVLLSGAHFQNSHSAVPAIAAYALAAPLLMALYTKWIRRPGAALAP